MPGAALVLAVLLLPSSVPPAPPDDAVVLFDGSGTEAWVHQRDGRDCVWTIDRDALVVVPGTGSIRTRETYGDFVLWLEFAVPEPPAGATGQARANSGVYIHGRYEVQILDSWGDEAEENGCAAIYRYRAPAENASRPAGEWQSFVIRFTAPRWDEDGSKTASARITVWHNDALVHDDVEITRQTGLGAAEGPEPGPIVLQDHGNEVRFRNVLISGR